MAFQVACSVDELWEGEMETREVGNEEVLLVWPTGGNITAYQSMCPHQEVPLIEGRFDGKVLTCRAHLWSFDACTGKGVNPSDCELAKYPLRIEDGQVLVDLDVELRRFTHT